MPVSFSIVSHEQRRAAERVRGVDLGACRGRARRRSSREGWTSAGSGPLPVCRSMIVSVRLPPRSSPGASRLALGWSPLPAVAADQQVRRTRLIAGARAAGLRVHLAHLAPGEYGTATMKASESSRSRRTGPGEVACRARARSPAALGLDGLGVWGPAGPPGVGAIRFGGSDGSCLDPTGESWGGRGPRASGRTRSARGRGGPGPRGRPGGRSGRAGRLGPGWPSPGGPSACDASSPVGSRPGRSSQVPPDPYPCPWCRRPSNFRLPRVTAVVATRASPVGARHGRGRCLREALRAHRRCRLAEGRCDW